MNGQFGMGMPMNNMNMMGGMGMPMNNMNMMGGMGGMGMPMNNMNMMGGMGGMGMPMNYMDDEDWMKGFKMGVEEVNNIGEDNDNESKLPGPKLNVIFKTTKGTQTTLVLSHGTTIDTALKKYLKRIGKPELINKKDSMICFLYNAAKLQFGDNTTVEQFFKFNNNPTVVVNDVNNLIGA